LDGTERIGRRYCTGNAQEREQPASKMKLEKDTRVFVIGCGGMLGQAVYERFSRSCSVLATDIDVNETWLEYLDVRDIRSLLRTISEFKPHLIINLAALTDLEYCEQNPEEAWLTNAMGQENICSVGWRCNATVVYISTAGVFDGKKEFYHDFDAPNPLSYYGKAKYYGETITQLMLNKYFIFRAGWMMGGGIRKDKKFINKIFKQVKAGSKELFVVNDKLGTPTYTFDFANSMFKVIESDLYGLYNMVCAGNASRYDVAREFLRCLRLEDSIKLTIVGSDYFKIEYFAPRPDSEQLMSFKLTKRGMHFMRDWKTCLAEYSGLFHKEL
jgi:dTDP-4-dehydrorhamnose reductase